jgi:hypothetical protein
MSEKEKDKDKDKDNNKGRTLSEDFFSRSPATQYYIKSLVGTIPTSRDSFTCSNVDVYYAASPNTQHNMVIYGLVPPSIMIRK